MEDTDDASDKPVKVEKDPSGFEFDPADAFREFDLSRISDPEFRARTAEHLAHTYGCQVNGDMASLPTDTRKLQIPKIGELSGSGTLRDLEAAARRANVADVVDLSGAEGRAATLVAKGVIHLRNRVAEFPALRKALNYVGCGKGAEGDFEPLSDMTVAAAFQTATGRRGIVFNLKAMSKSVVMFRLKRDVASGFHPKGCDTIESYVDHEIGHVLFDFFRLERNAEYKKILAGVTPEHVSKLSVFAAETGSDHELVAEAYAAFKNSPNPPEWAVRIGKLLDKLQNAAIM